MKKGLARGKGAQAKTTSAPLGKEAVFTLGDSLFQRGEYERALATWQPLYGVYKSECDESCRQLARLVLDRVQTGVVRVEGLPDDVVLALYLVTRRTHPEVKGTAALRARVFGSLWGAKEPAGLNQFAKLVESDKGLGPAPRLCLLGKVRALLSSLSVQTALDRHNAAYMLSAAATEFDRQELDEDTLRQSLHYVLASLPCAQDEALRRFLEREIATILEVRKETRSLPESDGVLLAPLVVVHKGCEARVLESFRVRLERCTLAIKAQYDPSSLLTGLLESGLAGHEEWLRGLEALSNKATLIPDSKRLEIALRAPAKFAPQARALLSACESVVTNKSHMLLNFFEGSAWNVTRCSTVLQSFVALCQRAVPDSQWTLSFRRTLAHIALQRAKGRFASLDDIARCLRAIAVEVALPDVTASVDAFCVRLAASCELLDRLSANKLTREEKKILAGKADANETRGFLSLLIDAGTLTADWHPYWQHPKAAGSGADIYFSTWRTLLECENLQSSLFAQTRADVLSFQCSCRGCLERVQKDLLPDERARFGFNEVSYPSCELPEEHREAAWSAANLIELPDPFFTLGVSPNTPKPEILARVLDIMRHEPARMADVRLAQRELFDPARRSAHIFLRHAEGGHAEPQAH